MPSSPTATPTPWVLAWGLGNQDRVQRNEPEGVYLRRVTATEID